MVRTKQPANRRAASFLQAEAKEGVFSFLYFFNYRGTLLLIGCHDEEQEGIDVFLVHIAFTCYIGHLFVKML